MSESEKSLGALLAHIRVASERVDVFIRGLNKAEFMRDERTQHAVSMALLTVGEAVAGIVKNHEQFANAHPELELQKVKGMRNRIAHGYFDLDFEVVWDTAKNVIPGFLAQIVSVMDKVVPEQCMVCLKDPCACGGEGGGGCKP